MGATKASIEVRKKNKHFEKYLNGKGIDIGSGNDALEIENGTIDTWDLQNGDAQYLKTIGDETYDFVYSSHCLEHMIDAEAALYNWSRVIKKDGYLFFVVPEYILYEKMEFPSAFNYDHKSSYSYYITKEKTKRSNHFHKDDVVQILKNLDMEVLEVQLEDENYNYNLKPSVDQTRVNNAQAQILFVAKKTIMAHAPHNNKIPVERVQTDYGELIILSKDTYQSDFLRKTGKAYDWQEVDLLNGIIKGIDNPVFFDVGSNLGAFTFGLAKVIKENNGSIHSFEPQRIVYNCLVGSVALNGHDHIHAHRAAIGNSQGLIEAPQFNYAEICSFGSIEFGEKQKERLHQARQENSKKEYVEIFPLDYFANKIDKLDLLKIDVEGMEESVLEGAKQIIAKYKPILFVEFFKSDKVKLRKMIEELGYDDISEVGVNFLCRINKTEMKKTIKIGLCMIVKNESKIIERCLDSVKPMIDYVCVTDTGSTDSTIEVINSWLIKNNMPGQVASEPWKNFAHNRSFVLAKLREQKDIDYALMIDADEILTYEDGFNIAEAKRNMKHDLYNINCKLGGLEYVRTTITKNNMPYYYRGVVHEFLDCREPIKTREMFNGICNIPLQDSARNENTQKFQNDARLLEDTLKTETDPFLISRYTFYLAQSYKDCGEQEKAIYWYNERAKQGFYNQEVYISLYKVAKLKEERAYPGDDIVQSYMRAHEICPGRIEALHGAINYCRRNGRNHQAFMMASYARSMPANRTGLFSQNWMWDYGIDDEYSITAYWTGHTNEGIEVTEKLLKKIPEQQKSRILKNLEDLKAKLTS